MNIQNIVVTGRLYQELAPLFLHQQLPVNFRFIAESEMTPADYEWADAYAGFKPAAHFQTDGLQWVHALGAGVDAFVRSSGWKSGGVLLTRTIGAFGRQISEYCLSYLLADTQHHVLFGSQQQSQQWQPVTPRALAGQRAVIFGTGTIGQELAHQLSHFGMDVTGVSRSGSSKPHVPHAVALTDCTEQLGSADWVINTLPLTQETEGLFNERFFGKMNGCGFINVGRGRSVCTDALLAALDRGQVRRAVLDVFEEEPLPAASRLWEHPHVTVTPHISAVTEPEAAARDFLDVLDSIRFGRVPEKHLVDPERGY